MSTKSVYTEILAKLPDSEKGAIALARCALQEKIAALAAAKRFLTDATNFKNGIRALSNTDPHRKAFVGASMIKSLAQDEVRVAQRELALAQHAHNLTVKKVCDPYLRKSSQGVKIDREATVVIDYASAIELLGKLTAYVAAQQKVEPARRTKATLTILSV